MKGGDFSWPPVGTFRGHQRRPQLATGGYFLMATDTPKSAKRDLKRSLLLEVLSWASDHPNEVEQEFRDSARPVIDRLEAILTAIS
jgi:hypothetical protein